MYTYTYAVYVTCGLKKKSPGSSYVFALLYSLIFGHIKRSPPWNPKKYLRGTKCSSTICHLAINTDSNPSTKQLHSPSLFIFPVPADVTRQHSGPFKFFKNVSITLVLHKPRGSDIVWNGNKQHCISEIFWTQRRQDRHASPSDVGTIYTEHRTDCSYHNY